MKAMTSENALRWCVDTTVWTEFLERVMEASERVDLSFLTECQIRSIDAISNSIDWRQAKFKYQMVHNLFSEMISGGSRYSRAVFQQHIHHA